MLILMSSVLREKGGSFGLKNQCFTAKKGVHFGFKSQCFSEKRGSFSNWRTRVPLFPVSDGARG